MGFLTISDPHEDGSGLRSLNSTANHGKAPSPTFALEPSASAHPKADPNNPGHVASMPGMVFDVAVKLGDSVAPGQKLLTLEAMKMQTAITAEIGGSVAEIHVHAGTQVETGDLLATIEA